MSRLSGGEAVVKSLIAHKVNTIFGLPGVQNDQLYTALYDHQDQVRVIHSRHEQGVAYMAVGYAMSTGKVGVYSVVPGPGFLNASAALSTAYANNSKVLCLVGQIASTQIGRGYGMLHEIPDQMAIMRTLTKWADRVHSPAEAPAVVAEAFKQMHTGRPRPVGVEVPLDVLASRTEVDSLAPLEVRTPPVDLDAADKAAKMLAESKQPMIFVGSGALDAAEEVRELAELLQAPVVASRHGHGILSSRHYLSLRTPAAHPLWAKADVVLGIGSRTQVPQQNWGVDENLKIIRIDIDPDEHQRYANSTSVSLMTDSKAALRVLIPLVEKYMGVRDSRKEEMEGLRAGVVAKIAQTQPQAGFLAAMRAELPDDGFFVDDFTQVGYVSRFAFPVYQPRTYLSIGYQGSLGWSLATALGVKVAHPDKPVLAIAGDGGVMFTIQELATAVQHQIGTVTVVFNDNAFGNVKRMQKLDYGNRVIASELKNPDFVKLAEAFGAEGLRAHTPEELRLAIRKGFNTKGPTLIEVPVDEMPAPWSLFFLPWVRPVKG